MTQTEKIRRYIDKYGGITPSEALREFGCMRLAARIRDLKKAGYEVNKSMVCDKNRFGETVRYARYTKAV